MFCKTLVYFCTNKMGKLNYLPKKVNSEHLVF